MCLPDKFLVFPVGISADSGACPDLQRRRVQDLWLRGQQHQVRSSSGNDPVWADVLQGDVPADGQVGGAQQEHGARLQDLRSDQGYQEVARPFRSGSGVMK